MFSKSTQAKVFLHFVAREDERVRSAMRGLFTIPSRERTRGSGELREGILHSSATEAE